MSLINYYHQLGNRYIIRFVDGPGLGLCSDFRSWIFKFGE